MKVGDLVRFTATNVIGTIVEVDDRGHWTEVKIFHSVEGVPNPTGFSMKHLKESAEVINESR